MAVQIESFVLRALAAVAPDNCARVSDMATSRFPLDSPVIKIGGSISR